MSKQIELHRHFNMVEMQQEDPSVKAWLGESYRPVGPYFEAGGKSVATGIDMSEQKVLMPDVLGIETTDRDYRKKVQDFFHELITNIPKDGLKLEVGLEDDTKPVSVDNLPLRVRDYIVYRHALNHPHVGRDKADAERNPTKRFYILDQNKVAGEAIKINSLEDRASGLYFKYKDDLVKTHQILTMMGINIRSMTKDEQTLRLKEFTRKDPKLNEVEQTERFKRFIEVCEDPHLEMKYLIEEMIGAQYLNRVGMNILHTETGKLIGASMQETVLFYQNPKNSRELNLLRAEYSTKVKKGDAYLPKEKAEPQVIEPKAE